MQLPVLPDRAARQPVSLLAAVNGFEPTFQIANAISGAFYFGLGSFLIYRACRLRYDVLPSDSRWRRLLLASNILHYASGDAAFAHVYGYCILSGLVYLNSPPGFESNEQPIAVGLHLIWSA